MNFKLLFLILFALFIGCNTTAPIPAELPPLRGVNLVGGEISYGGGNTTNPVSGNDYLFVSNQDIDYLVSKKISFVRLVFSWEVMQPTLNGPLNTGSYAVNLKSRVDYATSKGLYVLVEPHGGSDSNFARYKGNAVGTSAVPNSSFGDFWAKMALVYKDNPKVMFGLSNEPVNMSTMQWFLAAQAAITGIRSSGFNQIIFVPGVDYTAASEWSSNWYDTANPKVSNAQGWLTLKDPANNLVASVHMYLDQDAGGVSTSIVSSTIGVERLTGIVGWARTNKVKIHLSEIAASSSNSLGQPAIKNLFDYIEANKDVVIGWSWWAYGPPSWWGGYQFTLDPTNNYGTDDSKWSWLTPYLGQPAPPPTATTPPPVQDAAPEASLPDAGIADAGVDSGPITQPDASVDAGPPPPTVSVLKVVERTTYNWGSGYCKEFDFVNKSGKTSSWSQVQLNMRDGKIRDQNNTGKPWDTWNGDFSGRTGIVVVKAASWNSSVPNNGKTTIGLCADFSTTSTKWTATVVSGSLLQ